MVSIDAPTKATAIPPWQWPRAAYIHIPFCAHHCGYCDFAVAVGQDRLIERYLDALGAEMARLERPQPVQTIFLGGGTPTYLSAAQLERLFVMIERWLPLLPDYEMSIEANPASLDDDKIRVLADHGVNRVSLGAQSFEPMLLRVLERDHDPADVPRAVERVRRRIDNVSLDLIFGVPGQTIEQWQHDIERALELAPNHIATYGLTYEKGTRLWHQRRAGDIASLSEETELTMYLRVMDVLEEAGMEHYEISNFAQSGKSCRHNQVYWANDAYFGLGLGAARYVEGTRSINTRALPRYLQMSLAGEDATFQSECLAPRDRALETIAVQLRRASGICRVAFLHQTGFDVDDLVRAKIVSLAEWGHLLDDGKRIKLTRQGKCVADAVIREIYQSAGAPRA